MAARLNYPKLAPDAFKAMLGLENYLHGCGLEHGLLHMVKLRCSQMNGCAYCVDMHWKDARAVGESEEKLSWLSVWREAPIFTDRERAALAWAETLTDIHRAHESDAAYDAAKAAFTEKELVDLTWTIAAINAWNRMGVGFKGEPGHYRPAKTGG
jgi:AhpD family alkylhydroperoxidase